MYFLGCDPDTKHAAYAIVGQDGKLLSAWTVESDGTEFGQAKAHADHPFACLSNCHAVIESQQVYKNSDKSNPADLIRLARASGISVAYTSSKVKSLTVVLPSEWKGTMQKHVHQIQVIKRLGYEYELCGSVTSKYAVPTNCPLGLSKTQYKHVIDAIGLALWLRDKYTWEARKEELRKNEH